jgi:hypothetical protein
LKLGRGMEISRLTRSLEGARLKYQSLLVEGVEVEVVIGLEMIGVVIKRGFQVEQGTKFLLVV